MPVGARDLSQVHGSVLAYLIMSYSDPLAMDGQERPTIQAQIPSEMNDPVVRMVHWYELVSTVFIIGLMVFKPF
jgi:hypothetical protein